MKLCNFGPERKWDKATKSYYEMWTRGGLQNWSLTRHEIIVVGRRFAAISDAQFANKFRSPAGYTQAAL